MADPISFEFEMGYTHAEFLRLVPRAFRDIKAEIERTGGETRITVDDNGKTITITLGPQQARKIAIVSLPFVKAVFTFDGYDQIAAKTRLDRIMLSYRKGGG